MKTRDHEREVKAIFAEHRAEILTQRRMYEAQIARLETALSDAGDRERDLIGTVADLRATLAAVPDPADAYPVEHGIEGCACDDGSCWDQLAVASEQRALDAYEASTYRDEPQPWQVPA